MCVSDDDWIKLHMYMYIGRRIGIQSPMILDKHIVNWDEKFPLR